MNEWQELREKLAKGDIAVFKAGVLFTLFDQVLQYRIKQVLKKGIAKELKSLGFPIINKRARLVFNPFEHNNQAALTKSVYQKNKPLNQIIFEADIENIRSCYALFADLTEDDGTYWEIGFARAMNKPTAGIYTNFVAIGFEEAEKGVSCPFDPLIINSLGKFYYMPVDQLLMETKGQYSDQLKSAQRKMLEIVEEEGRALVSCPEERLRPLPSFKPKEKRIFVDFGFDRTSAELLRDKIKADPALEACSISIAKRNLAEERLKAFKIKDTQEESVYLSNENWVNEIAQQDLQAMLESDIAIFNSQGVRGCPETAVMQGIAYGLGKKYIRFKPYGTCWFGSGEYRSPENLMLDVSAELNPRSFRAKDFNEVIAILHQII